jgi:transposase
VGHCRVPGLSDASGKLPDLRHQSRTGSLGSRQELDGIEALGVDEVQWKRGHKYQTVVYQIDPHRKRLIWVGADREAKTLESFFDFFGKARTAKLQYICSDMWQGYLKVIAARASRIVHILDRFHVMQMLGRALDKVRAAEVKQLKADGYEPALKGSHWVLLKRPDNLTDKQAIKLKELLQYNLKSVRSHLMKEDFQRFWKSQSDAWASKFLDAWCTRAMRSKIEPMKKVAGTFRAKRELLLNWLKANGTMSSGVVEGLNNKLKLVTRKPYGFRTQNGYQTALYHTLGNLPEPETTHKFC